MALTFLSRRTALNDFVTRSGLRRRRCRGSSRLAAGELDHVEGRHGEAGTVDDAADVAVEADVGEAAVVGEGLARVFLALVAQLRDLRTAEQSVLVEAHLGVEGHDGLLLGDDQRVDLEHVGVEVAERRDRSRGSALELADDLRLGTETEGDLAGLEGLHADRGIDDDLDDRIGLAVRDLLDVHAAGGGRR